VTRFAADLLKMPQPRARGSAARPGSSSTTGPGSDVRRRAGTAQRGAKWRRPSPANSSWPNWVWSKARYSTPRSPRRSRASSSAPDLAGLDTRLTD